MAAPVRTASRTAVAIVSKGPGRLSSLRRLTIFSPAKAQVQPVTQPATQHIQPTDVLSRIQSPTNNQKDLSKTYFDGTGVLWVGLGGKEPPDPNKAKLGKSQFVRGWSRKDAELILQQR